MRMEVPRIVGGNGSGIPKPVYQCKTKKMQRTSGKLYKKTFLIFATGTG
jgi:hypothetical protein